MYDPFGDSHCLCASTDGSATAYVQVSLVYLAFAIDHPGGVTHQQMRSVAARHPRGDTLVTAGRRPADTATLPADSVPEGVALHYKTERPRYLTCPRITSGEVLIKSYVHLTLNSQELLVYRVAPQ